MSKAKIVSMTLLYIFAGIGVMSFTYDLLEFADNGGFCKVQRVILTGQSNQEQAK